MTNNANIAIQALRELSSNKILPTSVSPKQIRDITGLSEQELNNALHEIVDNGYQIVLTEGSNTVTNVSLSVGFK